MAESSSTLTAPCGPDWTELPDGITSSILSRLPAIDILAFVQPVCKAWHNVCKHPMTWRTLTMRFRSLGFYPHAELDKICRYVTDLSAGNLISFDLEYVPTDDLLHYITTSSSGIRQVRLVDCSLITDKGLSEMASKLPLLEDLEVASFVLSGETLELFGRSCPLLKSLKLEQYYSSESRPVESNDEFAHAISRTMHGLQHLRLTACQLSDAGVKEILKSCPNLESLDVSRYFNNANQAANLRRTSAQQIKALKFPLVSNGEYHVYDCYLASDDDW